MAKSIRFSDIDFDSWEWADFQGLFSDFHKMADDGPPRGSLAAIIWRELIMSDFDDLRDYSKTYKKIVKEISNRARIYEDHMDDLNSFVDRLPLPK